ncbi:MAG: hypothetical protein HDR06_12220 [Lachnospiraceae bacterium]|nr:hypothetical protein [Lachnospiraceae bacterium]
MLSEEQQEIISEALTPLFQYLESEVIADVAERIAESLSYTRTAELEAIAMRELGYSPAKIRHEEMKLLRSNPAFRKNVAKNTIEHKREVRKLLNEISREAYEGSNEILKRAADTSWAVDLAIWKEAGRELTDDSFLPQLVEAFARQTRDELKNLTRTTGFKTMSGYEPIESLYQKELDKALIKVCTGTFSKDKVIADTVHELAQSGLRSINFESGYSMQLDTAVRLAVRTGCHQISGRIMDRNMENTGENLVYVSRHQGARNVGEGIANHEQWQGKVYYIKAGTDYSAEAARIGQDQIRDLWEETGYSVDGAHENDPRGLYGYNCRHRYYVWFEGIDILPPELKTPKPVTIDGKTYDYYAMTQKMRSMERAVRALKREKEALDRLGMDTKEIDTRIRRRTAAYKEFCESYKIKAKTERLRYECGTSDLRKTKAWKEYERCSFKNGLKEKTLGVSDKIGNGSEPAKVGRIDVAKKEEAVKYFGEQIRDSDIEKLVVIDKSGNVYYNKGVDDNVSIGSLDLSDCVVLHNHPKTNDIVSFGKDDYEMMRRYPTASFRLVNERYDYYAEVIKPIDKVTYNQAWRWSIDDLLTVNVNEDLQHRIMESLAKRGYIRYGRKAVDGRTEQENK